MGHGHSKINEHSHTNEHMNKINEHTNEHTNEVNEHTNEHINEINQLKAKLNEQNEHVQKLQNKLDKYKKKKNNNENKNNDELKNVQTQLNSQSICMQLLQNEINIFRNIHSEKSIDHDILQEINNSCQNFDYEYLVFSGGGIKGISFAGAIKILHKLCIIYSENKEFKLKGVAGTSAGSIIASLLAIGYEPDELIEIISNLDFGKIADDRLGYIRDSINFVKDWGICPGNYILDFLGELINKKTGNPDYTIQNLYDDKNVKLVIVTTDANYSKSIYLYPNNPIEAYSKIPIRVAVRMSIGIPFVFEPRLYNESYFVDGGVLDNYPIHVFDGEYPGDPKARLNLCQPNPKVLGIKLMTCNTQNDYDMVPKKVFTGLIDYAMSFINTFLIENDRRIMTPSFWIRSIIIITPNFPISKFDINDEEKRQLLSVGEKYTSEFFKLEQ